jgi:CheY-like chemotaxis protein
LEETTSVTNEKSPPLVLVIDDDAELLDAIAIVLNGGGYDCHCCGTAEAAMEAARSKTPDLIISDINLMGYSGLELCLRIKEDEALRDVPVMFLSGAQLPDIIRRSHAVGGTYYLRKPFDPDVLLELISKALWMPHLVQHRTSRSAAAMTAC